MTTPAADPDPRHRRIRAALFLASGWCAVVLAGFAIYRAIQAPQSLPLWVGFAALAVALGYLTATVQDWRNAKHPL